MNEGRREDESHLFLKSPLSPIGLPFVSNLKKNADPWIPKKIETIENLHNLILSAMIDNLTPKVRRASMSPGMW